MSSYVRRVWVRATKHGRGVRLALRSGQRSIAGKVRRLPLPAALKRTLYRFVPWRPWTVMVPTDQLLLGGQNLLSAHDVAEVVGDLMWGSTPVTRGPHAQLLELLTHEDVLDEEILASAYGRMARAVLAETGNYFEAVDDAGIVRVARAYADGLGSSSAEGEPASAGVGRSAPGSHIRAARIRDSDCYQLVDGHHRAAHHALKGESLVQVRPGWLSTSTPLQDHLDSMSWIGGQRELYQPLAAPELAKSWVVVRRCDDRLEKMQGWLETSRVVGAGSSYLDVASCYGYFVAAMRDAGFSAQGVERDPLVLPIGEAAYGLEPSAVVIQDAVEFLRQAPRKWDVVSCLSLLHHFALGRGSVTAAEFIRLLDRITGRVLFFDTGQSHEEWLAHRLPGWDPPDIIDFLRKETSFSSIQDLGPDLDAVPPYEDNYGRHLFACFRDE